MFEWLKEVIIGGLAAFFGGLLSVICGYSYWTRLNKRVEDGEKEVKNLKDENIAKLEKKVDDHIKDDKSQTILNEIKNIGASFSALEEDLKNHTREDKTQQVLTELKGVTGTVNRINDNVDAMGKETARQGEAIKANAKYIENVDKSFQNHKGENHK